MANPSEVTVLNRWVKYGPGVPETVEVHLRGVVYDNQYFIELRDYYPERDHYGSGYLLFHGGRIDPQTESLEISDLIESLKEFHRG